MAASSDLTTVSDLVELYTSQTDVPIEKLDQLHFHDALTVRRDMAAYKKPDAKRIFVNRSLRLDRVEFIGFDMDYTVAIYTAAYEELLYNMLIDGLVAHKGYPEAVKNLPFDPNFSIRGLMIDPVLGHIIKVDSFGTIIVCLHGKQPVPKSQVAEQYASMRILNEDIGKRFYSLNTLFSTPEACAFANLVEFFESSEESSVDLRRSSHGVVSEADIKDLPSSNNGKNRKRSAGQFDISYDNLFSDIRVVNDIIHDSDSCKTETLKNLSKYIVRNENLAKLLDRFRQGGKKIFLLTNSPWWYTDKVMQYLLDGFNPNYASWRDYWDIIIVSGGKPSWFGTGATLREVDPETGKLSLSKITGTFQRNKVYHGGNLDTFERMAGISNGQTVLYVGDHIFADVRVSKKRRGWRTMLIVPELEREVKIWQMPETQMLYSRLFSLQSAKAKIYRDMDSNTLTPPDITQLRKAISATVARKDALYNTHFGSLFSSGLKPSFFSQQVLRYACIYAASFEHLLNYPLFYSFTPEVGFLLPHETVVKQPY
jgi:5'-nucleotidase